MSGGHWEYAGSKIRLWLEKLAEDEDVLSRFPDLAKLIYKLADILYETEHQLDWDLSGDSRIKDDRKFELDVIADVFECAILSAPNEWFVGGKEAVYKLYRKNEVSSDD